MKTDIASVEFSKLCVIHLSDCSKEVRSSGERHCSFLHWSFQSLEFGEKFFIFVYWYRFLREIYYNRYNLLAPIWWGMSQAGLHCIKSTYCTMLRLISQLWCLWQISTRPKRFASLFLVYFVQCVVRWQSSRWWKSWEWTNPVGFAAPSRPHPGPHPAPLARVSSLVL